MLKDIFIDYLMLAKRKHIRNDLLLGLATILVIISVCFIIKDESKELLNLVKINFGYISTFLSILAGFNMTSLSILANSNSASSNVLRNKTMPNSEIPMVRQIYVYFAWAVVVQLITLLVSLIIGYLVSIPPQNINTTGLYLLILVNIFLLFNVLYSIILTLRNIMILYYWLRVDK